MVSILKGNTMVNYVSKQCGIVSIQPLTTLVYQYDVVLLYFRTLVLWHPGQSVFFTLYPLRLNGTENFRSKFSNQADPIKNPTKILPKFCFTKIRQRVLFKNFCTAIIFCGIYDAGYF